MQRTQKAQKAQKTQRSPDERPATKRRLQMFAVAAPGLEELLKEEIAALGIRSAKAVSGGVTFGGSHDLLFRTNLWSRIASRVVVRVDEFHANSFHELERRANRVQWMRYLQPAQPFAFRVTCRKSRLYHSDAVAQRLAQAVVKQGGGALLAAESESEPDSNTADPTPTAQLFVVRLVDDVCTISADSSGALLHRRGYRQAVAKAPLRETLAAAMLAGSGWDRQSPLVDPMCGSGTIAIEGAMMARHMAPGLGRKFAFERWPAHDAARWQEAVDEARGASLERAPSPILASDRDAGAVEACRANAERAGVAADVSVELRTLTGVEYPANPGWVVTNPPYGLRLGEAGALRNLYAQLGKTVRTRAPGYHLALLSADKMLEAQLRRNLREVFRTTNGGIPVRLLASE